MDFFLGEVSDCFKKFKILDNHLDNLRAENVFNSW